MGQVGIEEQRRSLPWMPVPGLRRDDLLLAGVLCVAGLVEIAVMVPDHAWVATPSLLVMSAAVAVRRGSPRLSLALVLVALAVQTYLGVPVNAQLVTMPLIVITAYSVGAHLDRRDSAIGLAIGAALVTAAIALSQTGGSDFGFGLLIVTAPWIAGVLVRSRRIAEAEVREGAEVRARQAAEDERTRIARELHDIVSHGLSAMVVQAATAAELVDHAPEAARKAMLEVQASGTAAMSEMHHLLALTRGGEALGRRPQPDLADVQELVEAERTAGRSVSLSVRGTPHELPRGLALSIFRIVQESLTNVRKHAGGSRSEVTIAYIPGAVEVKVCDDGVGSGGRRREGFGIIGMRERARLYGGTLEAGPGSPGPGWVVRCRLPVEQGAGPA